MHTIISVLVKLISVRLEITEALFLIIIPLLSSIISGDYTTSVLEAYLFPRRILLACVDYGLINIKLLKHQQRLELSGNPGM